MADLERMMKLRQQGFFCSQIILSMGLEMQGKTNPDLLRASHALAGGLGFTGELCGALTGGAALLGLYAGKGTPEEQDDPRLLFMVEDLVNWFKAEYGEPFGGIRCEEILAGDSGNQVRRCPLMVDGVYQKVKELLVENGYSLTGLDE